MDMLESAKDTVSMGPARKSLVRSAQNKKLTAYHESGHALVALLLGARLQKATMVPRGHSLGHTSFIPNDELQLPKQELLTQLDIAMGGRVAEEIIFGPEKVTTGASSDFSNATDLAYSMVAHYGMSDKLGHMKYDLSTRSKKLSSETRSLLETEVKRLLEDSHTRTRVLMTSHQAQLHSLATALLEYETLTAEEIKMAVDGKDIKKWKEAQRVEHQKLIEIVEIPAPKATLPHLEDSEPNPKEPNIH